MNARCAMIPAPEIEGGSLRQEIPPGGIADNGSPDLSGTV
jgi:hypothetical protein